MDLLPAIDLRGGRAVRLLRGEFTQETPVAASPGALLQRFAAAGAGRVHVVDLDGARDGAGGNRALILELVASGGPRIQAGGGLRRAEDVEQLLAAGVDRAVVGSVAAESPETIGDWIRRFGPDRLVAALDVRIGPDGTPRLATHGWQRDTGLTLWDLAERLAAAGLRHALCTDIGRDGAMAGPNAALYGECARRFPAIAWQASGGVRNAADLYALAATGVAATISGRALIEDRIPLREIAPFLPAA
jgi:phosphoribosylformimino-5-aminoimidazole carboxamide ribotide isomerase